MKNCKTYFQFEEYLEYLNDNLSPLADDSWVRRESVASLECYNEINCCSLEFYKKHFDFKEEWSIEERPRPGTVRGRKDMYPIGYGLICRLESAAADAKRYQFLQ